MEFLEGETLAERLKRGALPIGEALQYASQIADALDKAHRAGIVHRDLKPGNIFLTRSGGPSGPPIAKLLDFGLAKAGGAGAGSSGAGGTGGAAALASAIVRVSMLPTEATPLTVEGTILGTLQLWARSSSKAARPTRTDIFAFGSVLYKMVTGRRAYQGKSQVSLMAAIIDQEPQPISAVQPVSPPLLEHLVRTCLAKNPDARWQDAGDLLIQLKLIAEQGAQPNWSCCICRERDSGGDDAPDDRHAGGAKNELPNRTPILTIAPANLHLSRWGSRCRDRCRRERSKSSMGARAREPVRSDSPSHRGCRTNEWSQWISLCRRKAC
jgi:serine/threonine protein kinase